MAKEPIHFYDLCLITKFCCHIDRKRLEITFDSYYDIAIDDHIDEEIIFIIEDWTDATILIGTDEKIYKLDNEMRIFKMVFDMQYLSSDNLEMYVETADGKHVTVNFFGQRVSYIKSK